MNEHNKYRLSVDDVRFFSSASPVHKARLFEWNGELYRAVRADAAPLFYRLFKEGIIEKLIDQGLVVETWMTSLNLEGYDIVLKHRRLPFVTYPFEWSAQALKDAAFLVLDLNIELAKHRLVTQDSHPWNVLFDGPKPVWVDVGAFTSLSEINPMTFLSEFYGYFIYPLRLMALGQFRVARLLLHDHIQPISRDEYSLLKGIGKSVWRTTWREKIYSCLKQFVPAYIKSWVRATLSYKTSYKDKIPDPKSWQALLIKLRQDISRISIKVGKSPWSDYYEKFPEIDKSDEWTVKQKIVSEILTEIRPKTVIDIGSNRGWYSLLAAYKGSSVIACDIDEACLDQLYLSAKEKNLYVIPLYMNLRAPSPAYGWCGSRYPAAADRLKADCALALALVHHLVFHQMADFGQIVNALSQFTKKYLIVEFVSKEDRYVRQWWDCGFSWYTLDNFVSYLRTQFNEIDVFPSSPEGRFLILCAKNENNPSL